MIKKSPRRERSRLIAPMIAGLMGLLMPAGSLFAIAFIDIGGNDNYNRFNTPNSTASGQAGSEADANAEADAEADVDISVSGSFNVLGDDQVIEVRRSDVEADTAGGTEPGTVLTNDDLRTYASSIVQSDANIESMRFTGRVVELRYRDRGHFLAIIPMSFTATVVAYADGKVEVRYPWYSFLTVDNKDEIETRIAVAVDSALWQVMSRGSAGAQAGVQAEAQSESDTRFTASEAALVASRIQVALRSSTEAQTEVRADLQS